MKYIVTLFWSFILGHVAYYLGSSLTSVSYDFTSATILGLIVAVGVVIIANILKSSIETKPQS